MDKFGGNGLKIRRYKYKVWGNDFPWSGVNISKHVKQDHDMFLPEYTVTFEKHANMISTHAHLAVISLPRNIKETMKVKQVSNNEDTSNVWLEECKLNMNEGLISDVIVPKES